MAKIDIQMLAQAQGEAYAWEMLKKAPSLEEGFEELERKVKYRGVYFHPLQIPEEKMRAIGRITAKNSVNTILTTCLHVLEKRYGFGKVRLNRFAEEFIDASKEYTWEDPDGSMYMQMSDLMRMYRNDYGIKFTDVDIDIITHSEVRMENERTKRIQWDRVEKNLKNSYPEALEHLRKVLGI